MFKGTLSIKTLSQGGSRASREQRRGLVKVFENVYLRVNARKKSF